MTREEFELLQQRLQNSGLGIMKFLRSENINHSTYTKWKRRFSTKENATSKTEQTLAPVTISHTKCSNIVPIANRLTIIFPNGVKVQVPVGFESSAVDLITSYPYGHVLPK